MPDIDAIRADLATRHRLMRTTTLSAASAAKQVTDMLVEEIPALLAEVDRLRDEMDAIGNLAYRFGHAGDRAATQDLLMEIQTRAKRAAKGE